MKEECSVFSTNALKQWPLVADSSPMRLLPPPGNCFHFFFNSTRTFVFLGRLLHLFFFLYFPDHLFCRFLSDLLCFRSHSAVVWFSHSNVPPPHFFHLSRRSDSSPLSPHPSCLQPARLLFGVAVPVIYLFFSDCLFLISPRCLPVLLSGEPNSEIMSWNQYLSWRLWLCSPWLDFKMLLLSVSGHCGQLKRHGH